QFTSLTFTNPILMLQAPNDASQWYIVEQAGIVKRFATASPTSASQFIDLRSRLESGGEKGVLGMAFHPAFPTNPRVYLSYTARESGQLVSKISAFTIAAG